MTLQVEGPAGERYVGTGFLALTNDTVVTAWHMVADARKVTARFADNEFVEALGVVDKDEKSDLALIRLPASSRPQVQLNLSNAPVGSRAYVIGAPKGYEFSIADGLISQLQHIEGIEQYQVSCPISKGNSGGPLVNGCGEVIGVTSWSKADAQNINFAIPSVRLLALNPALTPKSWSASVNPDSATARHFEPTGPAIVADSIVAEGTLLAFKQALQNVAGEEITIFLLKAGRAESFTFVLPPNLFDERAFVRGTGSVPAVEKMPLAEEHSEDD